MSFEGKYRQTSSDNCAAFLEKVKMPEHLVATLCNAKFETEISCEDNEWTVNSTLADNLPAHVTKFKFDEEFEEKLLDGTTVTSKMTLDGNKWIHLHGSDPPVVFERVFTDEGMEVTYTCEDVSSTRIYERVNE